MQVLCMCLQNGFKNGVYPASPASWVVTLAVVLGFYLAGVDPSFGWIETMQTFPRLVYGSNK